MFFPRVRSARSAPFYLVVARPRTDPQRFVFRRLSSPRALPRDRCRRGTALPSLATPPISMFRRPARVVPRLRSQPIRERIAPPAARRSSRPSGLIVFDFRPSVSGWHVGLHRSDTLWNLHKIHHSTA